MRLREALRLGLFDKVVDKTTGKLVTILQIDVTRYSGPDRAFVVITVIGGGGKRRDLLHPQLRLI